MKKLVTVVAIFSMLATSTVFALDISFVNKNIWLSKDQNVELGETVTVYSMVVNNDDKNIGGEMVFLDINTNQQVGNVVSFSLPGKGTSQVLSTQWVASKENHQFKAKVINAYEIVDGKKQVAEVNLSSTTTAKIYVDHDEDGDGWLNLEEKQKGTDPKKADTDGDTLKDSVDPDPLKKDADGDGDPDNTDPEPLNPDVKTQPDTDGDGTPDPEDSDKDNDGLYNWEEAEKGTDELKYDTDGDGVNDLDDAYPTDSKKSKLEVVKKVEKEVVEEKADSVDDSPKNIESSDEEAVDLNIPGANIVEEVEEFLNATELDGKDDIKKGQGILNGLEPVENKKVDKEVTENKGSTTMAMFWVFIAAIVILGVGYRLKKSRN